VSKANKRERQRMNREARREYEEALAKRRRLFKGLRTFAIIAVPILAIGVFLSISNSGDDTKAKSTPTFKNPPPLTIDPSAAYTATIATSEGDITVDLAAQAAPTSVNNFVFLAQKGFYDGLSFNRAAKDFVIQGGDPKGAGSGGPGYTVQGEVPADGYTAGSVAWAKSGAEPDGSASSPFFIVLSDQGAARLGGPPYQYGNIGTVTQGLDVAQKIGLFAPASGDGKPTKKVTIKKVTITSTGGTTTTSAAPAATTPSS
jgi:cyclophilin family peptidyl-prolyl cis-trans isomerase